MPVLAGRPEATRAAQYVVRAIQGRSLRRGDRIPSQQELCAATGFSNNAISAAMRVLVANGILTRKPKVGTVVVDPDRNIRGLWKIGVVILPATSSQPYYGELFHRVQTHLQDAGCITSVYHRNESRFPGYKAKFEHFDYLLEDLERRPLDGILDLASLDGEDWQGRIRAGLAMVHAGAWEGAPVGVVIEHGRMVQQAVHALTDRGCRRMAVVSIGGYGPGYDRFWIGFETGMKEVGLSVRPEMSIHGGEGPIGGRNVAEKLLAIPREARPDGLIVMDDRVAMGLAASLVQTDYRPRMVVQTNLQAPLAFALPVVHCEVDIEELATRAVNMLFSHLNQPDKPGVCEWLYPRILNPAESHMSSACMAGPRLADAAALSRKAPAAS